MNRVRNPIARILAWILLAITLPIAGAAIAYPLWYVAVNHRLVYTIAVPLCLALIVGTARQRRV